MTTHISSANQVGTRRAWFTLNGALWTIQALIGVFFAGNGFGKVLMIDAAVYAEAPKAVAWFAAVPQPLIVSIGVAEVLGGIGLILPAMTRIKPRLTPLAAGGLVLTMISAAVFHIVRGEYELVLTPIVVGGALVFVAVGRWNLRPLAAESVTTAKVLKSVAVLAGIVVVGFGPTWFTMTGA